MFHVVDEFSQLTDVAVCLADQVPSPDEYVADHPEFTRYVAGGWDAGLLRRQHRSFVETLESRGVRVHAVPSTAGLPWQMYTRDVAFVIGSTMFFSRSRGLPERDGEIDVTRDALRPDRVTEIRSGPIEGGDVVVHDGGALVGLGSRTSPAAAEELGEHVDVETLQLGATVMHLDTRLTLLAADLALVHTPTFAASDLTRLRERFELIEITDAECGQLATNVFVVDPETVVLDRRQRRVADQLKRHGFRTIAIDYSEPIALSGSFRCATMPLARTP